MLKSGRNPIRRNKNIGTAKSGRGKSNRLVIAQRWADGHIYYEKFRKHTSVTREINGRQLTFIVEQTRSECFHACTVDDIEKILLAIRADDWDGIVYFVLRQPKRKEEILKPCWGRLAYSIDYRRDYGPAIFLEAQTMGKEFIWDKSLGPDDQSELERLREDGATVIATKKHYRIRPNLDSTRTTQLYRTLIHEIGHWVDYNGTPPVAYNTKSSRDRESFAHRYATESAAQLRKAGVIPFNRILDFPKMQTEGILASDFVSEFSVRPRASLP
jgi:hypothetical protein